MKGISMEELQEMLVFCHEVEFTYEGKPYVIQPDVQDDKAYLVIWNCTDGQIHCISRHQIPMDENISMEYPESVKLILFFNSAIKKWLIKKRYCISFCYC